ncbi:hypothetical protein ISS30_01935 [bacterium]|nr:hypothetical protein [FCB group bacterium]MBL7190427.1 hypothetical protein [bacterium]
MKKIITLLLLLQFTLSPAVYQKIKPGFSPLRKPVWLETFCAETEDNADSPKKSIPYLKPIAVTLAAGGVTFMLYSIRSK